LSRSEAQDQEYEADIFGAKLALDAGFEPFAATFTTLLFLSYGR